MSEAATLESRCAALEQALAELRARATELESLKAEAAAIERELAEARRLLAMHGRSASPLLDSVRIASPCKADWDLMVGDDRVRFCCQCNKNVYNLSAMTRDEAEALLREKEGGLCARLYKRDDGTVLTTDCPVGVRKKRVRRLAVLTVGGGAIAAASAVMSARGGVVSEAPPCKIDPARYELTQTQMMGAVAEREPEPPPAPTSSGPGKPRVLQGTIPKVIPSRRPR